MFPADRVLKEQPDVFIDLDVICVEYLADEGTVMLGYLPPGLVYDVLGCLPADAYLMRSESTTGCHNRL